jgi:2-dehydro-3-deoxygluconokinase
MRDRFGFRVIASTLRESYSASDNGWSGLVYDGNEFHHTHKYDIHLVDRGGGGASFAAGIIYGLMEGKSLAETGEFAVAASALKQTILGDFNLVTVDEVLQIMKGDTSGRVQR